MSFNLIIVKQAPYSGRTSHEILEAVMSLALFEVPHKLVFFGPALTWLINGQDAGAQKSIEKQLKALPMYGSEDIYFIADHKEEFLGNQANNDVAEPISLEELSQWFRDAKQVEVF
jgi:sulfur relay (sulfurtransferase) DsrF/TusC family protein